MDSKTLIDAKGNHEKYEELIVRVWRFSDYFYDLSECYQNMLTGRAKKAEAIT